MWAVPLPGQAARDVYLTCISKIPDPALKDQMSHFADDIADAEEVYVSSGRQAKLYNLDKSTFTPSDEAVRTEMIKTYGGRMAKLGAPGRPLYDQLKQASPQCPLCGHRDTYTLDHYLPKSGFPLLSVTPMNLVPACTECNHTKSASSATTEGSQTLHPYFDDVDHHVWLMAEVLQGPEPAVVFYASPPSSCPPVMADRIRHHFATFRLADLYASQAATELRGIEYELTEISDSGGEQAVRSHLKVRATSWSRGTHPGNHWKTAAYRALAASSWYCNGGFAFH